MYKSLEISSQKKDKIVDFVYANVLLKTSQMLDQFWLYWSKCVINF